MVRKKCKNLSNRWLNIDKHGAEKVLVKTPYVIFILQKAS